MSAKLRPVPAQRRMPVRTQDINLTGEYEGWQLTIRANAPAGVLRHLEGFADATERDAPEIMHHMLDFIGAVLIDWNFVDEEGEPIPATREGCDKIPAELVMMIMEEYKRQSGALPKDSPIS